MQFVFIDGWQKLVDSFKKDGGYMELQYGDSSGTTSTVELFTKRPHLIKAAGVCMIYTLAHRQKESEAGQI